MEAEEQQQEQQDTDRTGWVIDRHDGTFNAAASWVNIQNARAPNGEEDAADEPAEPAAVAEEMLSMGRNGEDRQAVRAAQLMEDRFQEWDAAGQDRRRQEFTAQVLRSFVVSAAEMEDAMPGSNVVVVSNLADGVSAEMLEGTFAQIGSVREVFLCGSNWGWVAFEQVGDAVDAVMIFSGVELAGQGMVCRLGGLVEEWLECEWNSRNNQ
jgi:hypothetical protein